MGVVDEYRRLTWGLRIRRDFAEPRAAFYGWVSTHNLGDDAALWALKRFFVEDLAVITPQTYRSIPHNLKVLVAGASGGINPTPAAHILKYLERIPNRQFPCALVSSGVNRDYGDDNTDRREEVLKRFLKQFEFLSVRDKLSQRFVERLGFRDVIIIPDLVLTLPRSAHREQESPAGKNQVGLVLASNNAAFQKERDAIVRFLVETCDHVIAGGREVLCIPFQVDLSSHPRKQHSEIVLAREIRERLAFPEKFVVMDRMLGPLETLALIERELHYMISMRLHGNVFAARAGVPFISLSYNEKHSGFLEMMGMPDSQVVLKEGEWDLSMMTRLIAQIEGRHSEIASSVRERANALREQAIGGLKRMQEACPVLSGGLRFDR
jgi:polysaccharide pyruvyl transferase WcaK-like protein